MASPYVRKLTRETGKSEGEILPLWNQALEITSEDLGVSEDSFGQKEYKHAMGIVRNMIGMNEKKMDPVEFLNSDLSAKEYLETVVSGDFGIDRAVYPPDPEDVPDEILYDQEDEDEDEDDEEEMSEEVGADDDLIDPNGMSQPDREADSDVPYNDSEMDEPEDDGELPDNYRETLQAQLADLEEEQWAAMDDVFKRMHS